MEGVPLQADNSTAPSVAGQQLLEATCKGSISSVDRLLASGADVFFQDASGQSALHLAAQHGRPDIAQSLLQAGASPFVQDVGGAVPLHHAAQYGSATCAELLLRHKADPQCADHDGRTPLHQAAAHDQPGVLRAYAKLSLPLDTLTSDRARSSALHLAVAAGHIAATTELLRLTQLSLVSLKSDKGSTVLHVAAAANQAHLIPLLVEGGAEMDAKLTTGRSTPLHLAAEHCSVESAQELLRLGADAGARNGDSSGWTPLHTAAWHGCVGIVELMVAHRVDVNTRDSYGYNAMHLAAESDQVEVIRRLLEYPGVDVSSSARPGDGWTPLHAAARHASVRAARLLIEHGADPLAKTSTLWGLLSAQPRDVAGMHWTCGELAKRAMQEMLAQYYSESEKGGSLGWRLASWIPQPWARGPASAPQEVELPAWDP